MSLGERCPVTNDLRRRNFFNVEHDILKAIRFDVVRDNTSEHDVDGNVTAASMGLGVKDD